MKNIKDEFKRAVIVGPTCSGKSTLAQRMANLMGSKHIELDAIFWGPDWSERDPGQFREIISKLIKNDSWVVDGNYKTVRDIVLSKATALIWLNYSFPRVFYRAFSRTTKRIVRKEKLFSGNTETFRSQFLSKDSLLLWLIKSYRPVQKLYRKLFDGQSLTHLNLTEFNHPSQTEEFINMFINMSRNYSQ